MPSNQESGGGIGGVSAAISSTWSQSSLAPVLSQPPPPPPLAYLPPGGSNLPGRSSQRPGRHPADAMLLRRLPPQQSESDDLLGRSCHISGFPSNLGGGRTAAAGQMTSVSGDRTIIYEETRARTPSVYGETGTSSSGESSAAESGPSSSSSPSSSWDKRTTCVKNGRRTIKPPEDPDILDPTRRMRRRELSQFNPEEAERIVRRRERNKVAATKCRVKRRAQHEELVKELQSMECNNTTLTYEIRQLQRERQALSDLLRHHQMSCSAHPLQQLQPDPLTATSGIPGPYPLPFPR